jgi:DNA-binding MarR family transcriptional regulator
MSEFDYQQLDDLIHSRIRLSIMALLAGLEDAEFTYLRDKVGATDGNLGAHLRKLEEASYIEVEKRFVDRKPVSRYQLTPTGRRAFRAYVERVGRLLGVKEE